MEPGNASRIGALIAAAIGVALAGCDEIRGLADANAIKGNGKSMTDVRTPGEFDAVEAGSAFKITIAQGDTEKVEVKTDENLVPYIETMVENGVLKIRLKNGSYSPKVPMEASIVTPRLTRVSLAGASEGNMTGFAATDLELFASGASTIRYNGGAESLRADASGASTIQLGEVSGDADVRASGASKVTFLGKAGKVKADANGASEITLESASELEAIASGASSIRYSEKPETLKENASGASSISQK